MDKSWDIDGVNPILNPKVNLPSRDVFIEPIYGDIGGDLPLGLSHCHSTQYQMSVIDLSTYVYLNMDLCLFVSVYRIAYIYQHPPYCMYIYIYLSLKIIIGTQRHKYVYTSVSANKICEFIYIYFSPSLSVWLEVTVRTIYLPVYLPVYLPAYPCAYMSLSLSPYGSSMCLHEHNIFISIYQPIDPSMRLNSESLICGDDKSFQQIYLNISDTTNPMSLCCGRIKKRALCHPLGREKTHPCTESTMPNLPWSIVI